MEPKPPLLTAARLLLLISFVLSLCGLTLPGAAAGLELVSKSDSARAVDGGNGDSLSPIVTPDGNYVLFASAADNLVPPSPTNTSSTTFPAHVNVFLRDRSKKSTSLISVNYTWAGGGNGDSLPSAISENGRYVLFESTASDLVEGDTNGVKDIFLRDMYTGGIFIVSSSSDGVIANGESGSAAMTPDGRFVAFMSQASNLVTNDSNGISDIFLKDTQSGTIMLISVGAIVRWSSPSVVSDQPLISNDGRYVAFLSSAINLVEDPAANILSSLRCEVYLRDVKAGITHWASRDALSLVQSLQKVPGVGQVQCLSQVMSADGQLIAYAAAPVGGLYESVRPGFVFRWTASTESTELVHTNAALFFGFQPMEAKALDMTPDGRYVALTARVGNPGSSNTSIIVWDGAIGTEVVASVAPDGAIPAATSYGAPVLSDDGRYVAFVTDAIGLVTNAVSGQFHAYLRDLQQSNTFILDVSAAGEGCGVDNTSSLCLSPDAKFVVFGAPDGQLTPGDSNHAYDVFGADLSAGSREMISVHAAEMQSTTANGLTRLSQSSLSSDGRLIVFSSEADDLVAGDTNGFRDIFLRDIQARTNLLLSLNTNGAPANGGSFEPGITADGRFVVFTSDASDLLPTGLYQHRNVFLRDLVLNTNSLVSINRLGDGPGNGDSYSPMISSDGKYVLFRSQATNLASVAYPEGLFMRDLEKAETTAITSTTNLRSLAMTPDGKFVFYGKTAPGYVYLWDSQLTSLTWSNAVSVSGQYFVYPLVGIRPDGRLLVWATDALDLFYAADAVANTNWSFPAVGAYGDGFSPISFSEDGRRMAYKSRPNSSVIPRKLAQIWVYDFVLGTNILASPAWDSGIEANGGCYPPTITADGRFVAFRSLASNLVPGVTNSSAQIFLRDLQNSTTIFVNASPTSGVAGNNFSADPAFSGNGMTLAFSSWASNLIPGDRNRNPDIFLFSIFSGGDIPLFYIHLTREPVGSALIYWTAIPGKSYRVQFRDSLTEGPWRDLEGGVTLLGNQGSFKDPSLGTATRFYRVVAF